jgi:3',5'-cyclic AMP phosphodiesterase CpdA
VHGPIEVFVIDTILPLDVGIGGPEELAWLESALAASEAKWKVALMHHPAYSSGKHGSRMEVREALQPLFVEHGVDIAFTGHDHHYERTHPQDGVTWIVSGAGAKRTPVGQSDFTAHAESTLQFMLVQIEGDTMDVRAITTGGRVIDQVTLTARPSR